MTLRAIGLSISFESGKGLDNGFQPFFLIPLLLAGLILMLELAIVAGSTTGAPLMKLRQNSVLSLDFNNHTDLSCDCRTGCGRRYQT